MTEIQKIESTIKKGQRKIFVANCWISGWKALLICSVAVTLWLGLYKIFPISNRHFWVGVYLTSSFAFLAGLIKYLRFPSKKYAATYIDQKQNLQERLTTILEWHDRSAQSPWTSLMLKDVSGKIDSIEWGQFIRFGLPKPAVWTLLILIITAGLGLTPKYRSEEFVQKEKFNTISKETGKELAKVLNAKLEQRQESADALSKKLIEEGLGFAEQLGNTKLTKASALRKIENLSEQFKKQAQRLNLDPSQKRLMEAANRSTNSSQPNAFGDKLGEMETLNQKVGDLKSSKSELNDALSDLKDLKDLAKSFKSGLENPNTKETKALADSTSDLKQSMAEMGFDLEKLNNALNSLKSGDADEFIENLEFATKDLEELLDAIKALDELEQMIGKNLREQLEKGQIPAAKKTLEDMQQTIEKGELGEDERNQLAQDLMDAAEQMQNFPEMQQNLMQAARNLTNNNDEEAQQNLADASQNLDAILEQLKNAQDMQDILASLKNAGAALAAGKKWQGQKDNQMGQGQGPGAVNENMGGGGFGTWSDGENDLPQQKSNLVDQSGMSQQTLNERGVTERNQVFNQQNFTKDQLKGDLSPGSSMPSIPLHGLHIKGQSKVTYQEVISEIKASDAGSIDQSKIPRFYQKTVKNYFGE